MRNQYEWNEETDKFLIENYSTLGCAKCSEMLEIPYRAVQSRALKKLKVSKFSHIDWTDDLIYIINRYYPTHGGRFVSNILNLPITAVNKKANELGVHYVPKDEYISSEGYIVKGKLGKREAEHRLVMEKKLGRKLTSKDIVHHRDGNKLNNDPDNLVLTTRAEHIETHRKDLKQAKI
jgi:hypothetical protein